MLGFDVSERTVSRYMPRQQLRETVPFDTAPRHLIFDRDSIFSEAVVAALKSFGVDPTRTAWKSPWQNGVAERWAGSVRKELLGHVVVLNARHLQRLLAQYVSHHHEDRTHLGLGKDSPANRPVERRPEADAAVVRMPRVVGLHHRYEWHAAAAQVVHTINIHCVEQSSIRRPACGLRARRAGRPSGTGPCLPLAGQLQG